MHILYRHTSTCTSSIHGHILTSSLHTHIRLFDLYIRAHARTDARIHTRSHAFYKNILTLSHPRCAHTLSHLRLTHTTHADSESMFAMIASFGALATLLFAAPTSPFAQPRNVIGGHIIAAVCGLLVDYLTNSSYAPVLPNVSTQNP